MPKLITEVLATGYDTLVAHVGESVSDDHIVAALVRGADWTEHGAREVLQLARKYGTSILRNALALASAMNIEDGEAGL